MRREVYRNLHWKDETVYSVRKCSDGLVEGHAYTIIMDGNTKYPVTFAVGPKGNQRVRDEMRKNVHAGIKGYIDEHGVSAIEYPLRANWSAVTYNPYKYDSFVDKTTEEPIYSSQFAKLSQKQLLVA